MNFFVTGRTGFIGKHVEWRLGVRSHNIVDTLEDKPDAMIHLAWAGLPNYESEKHYDNIEWQASQIQEALRQGVTNITIAGTCLETAERPCHYAVAKKALWNIVKRMDLRIKWLRLPWMYGTGQKSYSLLPALRTAIARGDKVFHVAKSVKVFGEVRAVAEWICNCAEDEKMTGLSEYEGEEMSVADLCRREVDCTGIELVEDYPLKDYEE